MAEHVSVQNKVTLHVQSPLGIATIASGAVIAVFAGAIVWGLLASWTGQEMAWLAMSIGVLAGTATRLLAGNRSSVSFQLVAVTAAVIGVVAGKYYIYASFLRDAVADALGAQAAAEFSLFSSATFNFLRDDTGSVVGVLDAVWLAAAMYLAWRIPQGLDIPWRRHHST